MRLTWVDGGDADERAIGPGPEVHEAIVAARAVAYRPRRPSFVSAASSDHHLSFSLYGILAFAPDELGRTNTCAPAIDAVGTIP